MSEHDIFKLHSRMPKKVKLADITIRDGFQHEESWIPTEAKIYYLQELAFAGVKRMEVTNLGNPKKPPLRGYAGGGFVLPSFVCLPRERALHRFFDHRADVQSSAAT